MSEDPSEDRLETILAFIANIEEAIEKQRSLLDQFKVQVELEFEYGVKLSEVSSYYLSRYGSNPLPILKMKDDSTVLIDSISAERLKKVGIHLGSRNI